MSCPDCFSGHVHEGNPQGRITKVHGRDTYVADPPNGAQPKGYIIIIPDAFGWEFVNNRLLADNYATKGGYRVYLPDFMDGRAAPLYLINSIYRLLSGAWLYKPYNFVITLCGFVPFLISNSFGASWPKVQKFFEEVKKDEAADLPVGAAGFCWGGKHTLVLAHGAQINGKSLIDAGFTAHPSNLVIPGDIEAIKKPVALACAENDIALPLKTVTQIEGILKKNDAKYEVKIYEKAGHGFAVRADPGTEKAVEQSAEAEDQCIHFFQEHFPKV